MSINHGWQTREKNDVFPLKMQIEEQTNILNIYMKEMVYTSCCSNSIPRKTTKYVTFNIFSMGKHPEVSE